MNITGRDHHLITKALAIALETISRAGAQNQPFSDADDMAQLYLSLVPDELERLVHQHGVAWLFAGGIDGRQREVEPLPFTTGGGPKIGPEGEPAPLTYRRVA